MSSIDKMLIKGIRSFSPDNKVVIEFYKPLTLIVGHNGAGKTTVIECLKMSCTGEVPPHTNKGKSFIHDPKVAGETEVKAQIKLRFYNALHQPYIIIRSFQLTQKKTDLQFKALDSTIQTLNPETGVMEAMPHRCTDMNTAVPTAMGVSKAILENVIFVHQEDSNWPLAEGQVLKKKFDDIFAATKYTKALDDLRKLRLAKVQAVREMKLELENVKTKRDYAARLRASVAEGIDRAARFKTEIREYEDRIAVLEADRADIEDSLKKMANMDAQIHATRAKFEQLDAQNAATRARLIAAYSEEDVDANIDAIVDFANDQEEKVRLDRQELSKLERDVASARRNEEALKEQMNAQERALARLVADAEAHARNVDERDRFLREICAQSGAAAPPGVALDGRGKLAPEDVAALQAVFQETLNAARAALEDARQRHRAADVSANRAVDDVAAQISGVAEGLRMKEEASRTNEAKIISLQSQLDAQVGVNPAALDAARARQAAKEGELQEREAELDASSFAEEAKSANEEIAAVAARTEVLRKERRTLAAAAEEASRLNFKAQELQTAETKLRECRARHQGTLMLALGKRADELPPPGPQLTAAVRAEAERRRERYERAAAALKSAQARHSAAKGTLEATRAQLSKAEADLSSLNSQLAAGAAAAGAQDVHVALAEVENEKREKTASINKSELLQSMFEKFIKVAQEDNACYTCGRPFESTAQRDEFVVVKNHQKQSSSKDALLAAVAELETRTATLRALEPVAARQDALRTVEIPALKEKIEELEQEVGRLLDEEAEAAREEAEAGAAHTEAADALQDAAQPLARLAAEVAERKAEVEGLRATVRASDATRSVADVDSDLAAVEARRAELERARDAATAGLSLLRDAVATLRSELHREREEVLRLASAVERRAALEAQQRELIEARDALVAAVVEARRAREPLEARKAELEAARATARRTAAAAESKLEATLRELQTHETQLEARGRALVEYEERGGVEAVAEAEEKAATLRGKVTAAGDNRADLEMKLAAKKHEVDNSQRLQHQMNDILAYKKSLAEQQKLSADLDRCDDAMAAQGDRSALVAKSKKIEDEIKKICSERDHAKGALDTVEETAANSAAELDAPEYDDIDGKHRRAVIEVRTTEMASADLDKFHKALEKALLAFHTGKMADINRVVKELWQKTYRNSDIDYIQIRADTEGSANRSYNYRVVMVCGGAELDMRGRCSAGQRVLASLIIRLALAENFCINCGILALDEPTTNLDADNAQSLAEALKALMEARRNQENFQLIVITHDEAFAKHIGTREHAEFMWRIVKDENQHSTVIQEAISD